MSDRDGKGVTKQECKYCGFWYVKDFNFCPQCGKPSSERINELKYELSLNESDDTK